MKKYPLIAKAFVIGIILLFAGTTIIPTTAQNFEKPSLPTSRGHWLYVGGSGLGNYSKIQDAINDSLDGDTLFVYDDSSPYYEHVIIDKSITLVGEDRNTTIIDGTHGGPIFKIIVDYVSIRNLSIINSANEGVLIINSSYSAIQSCIISYNNEGICNSQFSENNIISNNILINNLYGILLFDNYFSTISENILVNNSYAIQIDTYTRPINTVGLSQEDTYITVSNNHIADSIIAVTINHTSLNLIKNNIIENNRWGVLFYGTYGMGCVNTLERNYIRNNDLGIFMTCFLGGASGNKIYQNTFLGNKRNVRYALYENNSWDQNYWGRGRFMPYPIFGWKHLEKFVNLMIPWIDIDWHPSQKPYDIPRMS